MATRSPQFLDGARKVRICQTPVDPDWSPQGSLMLISLSFFNEMRQFWSSSFLTMQEKTYLCSLLCDVKASHAEGMLANGPQAEFTRRLSECDEAWGWRGSMKAEVGFDTAQRIPQPMPSKRGPHDGFRPSTFPFSKLDTTGGYQRGRLRIPDIVVPYDPDLPPNGLAPAQGGNLWVIVEVKFGADDWSPQQRSAYEAIAGSDASRVLGVRPEYCNCGDDLRRAGEQAVEAAATTAAALLLRRIPGMRIPGGGASPAPVPAPAF